MSEPTSPYRSRDELGAPPRRTDRLYIALLWLLAVVLFAGLVGCASGTKENAGAAAGGDSGAAGAPLRLLLTGTASQDSIRMIGDFHVDQVLRQVFDSIAGVTYLTLNHRDSLALARDPSGTKGIALKDLAGTLDLDGGINVALARFGSVIGLDFQVVDAASGAVRFRDLVFQYIRYRDSTGTMLVGPALVSGLEAAVGRFLGRPHTKATPVATTPIVLSGIVIPNDPRLRDIARTREATSRSVLTALHDYAGMHFPELVMFDAVSRDRLYQTVRIAAVANYIAPSAAERRALFNVGIDRYLLGSIDPIGTDSLRMRLEIRNVVSAARDTVELAREMLQPVAFFSSSAFEEDVIVAMLDLAEPLFREAADSLTARYERARAVRVAGAER